MASLEEIRAAFSEHEPEVLTAECSNHAAVALVLREVAGSPELLFIERAHREGDPWSGHMAFPGGHIDPGDANPRGAAERETHEEVGVNLDHAEPLGRLDDLQGRHAGPQGAMVISAFVYYAPEPGLLTPNWEVEQAFWFPLASLFDEHRNVDYAYVREGNQRFPGIRVGEAEAHVVWGLTYRFLEIFFEVVGRPLPLRWGMFAEHR